MSIDAAMAVMDMNKAREAVGDAPSAAEGMRIPNDISEGNEAESNPPSFRSKPGPSKLTPCDHSADASVQPIPEQAGTSASHGAPPADHEVSIGARTPSPEPSHSHGASPESTRSRVDPSATAEAPAEAPRRPNTPPPGSGNYSQSFRARPMASSNVGGTPTVQTPSQSFRLRRSSNEFEPPMSQSQGGQSQGGRGRQGSCEIAKEDVAAATGIGGFFRRRRASQVERESRGSVGVIQRVTGRRNSVTQQQAQATSTEEMLVKVIDSRLSMLAQTFREELERSRFESRKSAAAIEQRVRQVVSQRCRLERRRQPCARATFLLKRALPPPHPHPG